MLKRVSLLLWGLCVTLMVPAVPYASAEAPPPLPQSVLWIGNSFTYYNGSIPAMVKALAEEMRPHGLRMVRVGMKTVGGAHLTDHAKHEDLGLGQDWDLVVLQGYSDETINPQKTTAFQQALTALAVDIDASGARPMLFMTWAYKHRPAMTQALAAAYLDAGIAIGAPVAPVGLAFAKAQAERPELALYIAKDNKHPSPAGTYLAACTFYAKLFGSSPEQAAFKPEDLPERDAAFLQRIAWETVAAYSASPATSAVASGG